MLPASSCTQADDRAPAADSEFKRAITWAPGSVVTRRVLRSVVRYCPPGSRDSGCMMLDTRKPTAAFATSNGHVVFFDRQEGLVEMDSAGQYVGDIGTLGNEPGSYMRVMALGGSNGGVFTIWDPSLTRLTVLRPSQPPQIAWVRAEGLEGVKVTDTFAIAISVPQGKTAGDRVFASLAPVLLTGKLGRPIATVVSLATRSEGSETQSIPSLFWPRPVWSLAADGSVLYAPPDTALRIEIYDNSGRPDLLITGYLPFPSERVTEDEIRKREAAMYATIFRKPMQSVKGCDGKLNEQKQNGIAINCQTISYLRRVGRRSPRIQPPITDIVSLAPRGFWIRTSRVARDSATWLMADSAGKLVGSVVLNSTERPIGRFRELVAIADSSGGRISVSWRLVDS